MNQTRDWSSVYRYFDVVEIYRPDLEDVRKFVSLPRKTIFINKAAPRDANVLRIGWTEDDALFGLPFDEE